MFDLSTGKLFIRKRNPIEWMVLLIIVLPFLFGLLFEFLRIPDFLKFSIDGALVILAFILLRQRETVIYKQLSPIVIFVSVFFVYTLISHSFNFQSVFYYIWGLRNNFRMYIALILFAMFLTKRDADDFLRFFDVVYWINFVLCLVQCFMLGYKQDYLGGVFGTQRGCNGYVNIFLCIVVAKSVILYLNKQESLANMLLKVASALFLCAISELKFFIIEFAVIIAVASLVTKFSWRKFAIIIFSFAAVIFGIIMMIQFFPEFADFFTFEIMFNSAASDSGYTYTDDINRLTAIPVINREILTTPFLRMFGLGLGNCDLSSIEIFNTPFYETHESLNYDWFSYAFMYLETGYIGMIMFFAFFILCFVLIYRRMKKNEADKNFCQIALIMSVMCIVIAIYGASLRSDAAYMAFFVLALPFISYVPDRTEQSSLANAN